MQASEIQNQTREIIWRVHNRPVSAKTSKEPVSVKSVLDKILHKLTEQMAEKIETLEREMLILKRETEALRQKLRQFGQ